MSSLYNLNILKGVQIQFRPGHGRLRPIMDTDVTFDQKCLELRFSGGIDAVCLFNYKCSTLRLVENARKLFKLALSCIHLCIIGPLGEGVRTGH